ncbi:hypothetical protein LSH36_579g05074 [Paralvinella palmiformis]|uniref:G-protein coupled receptors family 3 profile domain-containing protein n=1 Tax=Paralvinella palmiformis TaxID=53620 RepID=A0AAD9J5C5_9ANNE|nr:hypothetical protein LSH36_579g05074 [Paralvinella palmiformis]
MDTGVVNYKVLRLELSRDDKRRPDEEERVELDLSSGSSKMGTLLMTLECFLLITVKISSQLSVPGFKREAYVKKGDINIGMITYIHQFSSRQFCSEDVWRTDALRTEVPAYITELVNQDDSLLPNITLGFIVMDGCTKDLTALAASLFLVDPESVAAGHTVVGIVGPTTSRQAVMVSSLLGLFHIPALSPSATSDDLSDKQRFPFFTRLVPPDKFQAEAILDLVQHLGWSYVSVLYSEGTYGENGAKNVERLTRSRGICLAVAKRIPSDASEGDFTDLVNRMAANEKAPAVILFLEGDDLDKLFQAVRKANLSRQFKWIASDSFWLIKETDFVDLAVGALYMDFPSGDNTGFRGYLENVSWRRSTNPWMSFIFEGAFNCSWTDETNVTGTKSCQTYSTLGEANSMALPAVGKHIDGYTVYAKALHRLIGENCPELFNKDASRNFRSCIRGDLLLDYMLNVTFDGYSEPIAFDKKGDMNGQYVIRQLRGAKNGHELTSAVVGDWVRRTHSLVLDRRVIDEWPDMRNVLRYPVISICSGSCQPGHYYQRRELPCCWDCIPCREDEITTKNVSSCRSCPSFTWPDSATRSVCEPIEPTYLSMTTTVGLFLVIVGSFGTTCAVGLLLVYRIKRTNRLLKATSLELSGFIFVGCTLACVVSALFVGYPGHVVCVLRHAGFHLAVTIIYAPLLVKTSRVYRIFRAGKKGTSRPKFISTKIQIIFTCTMILIQVTVLLSLQLILPNLPTLMMPIPLKRQVEVTCSITKLDFLLPLTFNMILISTSVLMAFLTRKLPENFNESHYIFVSTSSTLFMWTVFLPTHFTVVYSQYRSVLLSICLQVNAFITMSVQYGPKVYAVFWLNEHDVGINVGASVSTGTNRIQHAAAGI